MERRQRASDFECGLAQFIVFSLIFGSLVRPAFRYSVYR
jgi:hypothetical protein